MKRHEARWGWIFITPVILGLALFVVGPLAVSFWLSFTNDNAVQPPKYVGTANYVYLLTADPSFWISARVTAYYAVGSVFFGLLFSFLAAMLLNAPLPGRGIFRTLFYLPSMLPATASGVLWAWIFHPTDGFLNHLLKKGGITGPAWTQSPSWALPALVIMSIWSYGSAMVIFLAGLQNTPVLLHEAASLDGATPWQRFWVVTWPAMTPILFFNLIMSVIGAMKAFDQAYAFGQTGPGIGGPARATLFYVLNLYEKSFGHFHMGLASAMAWILFAVISILTFLNFRLSRRWVHEELA